MEQIKEQIKKLETKLLMLDLFGLAYCSLWNVVEKKLNKLKRENARTK